MYEENKKKNQPALVDLTRLAARQKGVVYILNGGHRLARRLDAMGIRPGVVVTKLSNQLLRGPVIVMAGSTQIALGNGMARKIIVQLIDRSKDSRLEG